MSASTRFDVDKYTVALSKDAAKYYRKVDEKTAKRLNKALDIIAKDPFGAKGVRPIKNYAGEIQIQGWRIENTVRHRPGKQHHRDLRDNPARTSIQGKTMTTQRSGAGAKIP